MKLPDKIPGLERATPTPEAVGVVSDAHIPDAHKATPETVTASAVKIDDAALAAVVALASRPLKIGGQQ